MAQITTRSTAGTGATVKGALLSNAEVDNNLIALNDDIFVDNYPAIRPTLLLDFLNASALDPRVTFTRASTATFFDDDGALRTAQANVPRFDHDPVTCAPLGLLIEEQRTNSIRNNTMQGAVAGTPGTLPTNWLVTGAAAAGLTQTVVGTGTANGITYIDLRFNGTPSAGALNIVFDSPAVAATTGQSWALSAFIAVVGGTTSNTSSPLLRWDEGNPAFLRSVTAVSIGSIPTSLTRYSGAATIGASTTVINGIYFQLTCSAAPIDITLRIGLPQLEQGAFATSVIPTTTTATTRSADVASVNTLSPWFNAAQGTLFTESQQLPGQTASAFPRIAVIDDGTTNNAILTLWRSDTSRLYAAVTTGGVNQSDIGTSGVTQTNNNKIAGAYATNDFASSVNGGSVSTDISGTVPTGLTVLRIGRSSGVDQLNGYLRRITYYPLRIPDAGLRALTAP